MSPGVTARTYRSKRTIKIQYYKRISDEYFKDENNDGLTSAQDESGTRTVTGKNQLTLKMYES